MPFSYMDHTGDVGIEIDAASLEDLYSDAALAFMDILSDPDLVEAREVLDMVVEGRDPTELLIHWLEELLFLFDIRGLLARPEKLAMSQIEGGGLRLEAHLGGEEIDLTRHPIRVQIKAVTYHQLEVRREGGRWFGRVIFDI